MTSGKTELSKEQILAMLYEYDKKAAEAYAEAIQRIQRKLEKENIPLPEYTAYVIAAQTCCGLCRPNVDECETENLSCKIAHSQKSTTLSY